MKIDLGAGWKNQKTPLDEWTHLDIKPWHHIEIVCDFGHIPLDDGSVDEIFVGDVIEHIPLWRHVEVLTEWNRILKVGGVFQGRTPNAEGVMRRYVRGDPDMTMPTVIGALFGLGDSEEQQHYMTFNKTTLAELLAKYGFGSIDYNGSPGPVEEPWWLVWTCRKEIV